MKDIKDLFDIYYDNSESGNIKPKVVVRIRTSYYSDRKGAYVRKDITYLKRKSEGFNFFEEDVKMVGAQDTISTIVNFNECDDGIYELITIKEHRDWETGIVDCYDLKLVLYIDSKDEEAYNKYLLSIKDKTGNKELIGYQYKNGKVNTELTIEDFVKYKNHSSIWKYYDCKPII